MKKKFLSLFILPALLFTGCNGDNNSDLPQDIPNNISQDEIRDITSGFFEGYENYSAHDRLKTIATEYDGILLDFRLFKKTNNDVVIDDSVTIGRKGNVVWAEDTLISTSENVGVELPYTVKGAIKYVEEPSSFEAYYGVNAEAYTYYGTALKDDIDFSVNDIEDFFSLSDYLLAYLLSQTNGYIQTFANRKALLFRMNNIDMKGNAMEYSQLEIAFDWETRLIMHYNYWFIDTSSNKVNMAVFTVSSFKDGNAVVAPSLVK